VRADSQEWRDLETSDEFKNTVFDSEMYEYFYSEVADLHDQSKIDEKDRWTFYIDEPDKRTYYKKKEGENLFIVLTDTVCDANIGQAVACYDNFDVIADAMPELKNVRYVSSITDMRKVFYGEQHMPWPMWGRDMCNYYSCIVDTQNKALFAVQKSTGEVFHGVPMPPVDEKNFVRMDVKTGVNLFQYIGPNKTRNLQFYHCDPKVDFVPAPLMNFLMTNVCYNNCCKLQEISAEIN
jgi:hypothetical protein